MVRQVAVEQGEDPGTAWVLGEEADLVPEPCQPVAAAALARVEELDRAVGAVLAAGLPDLPVAALAQPPGQGPGAEPGALAERRRRPVLGHVPSGGLPFGIGRQPSPTSAYSTGGRGTVASSCLSLSLVAWRSWSGVHHRGRGRRGRRPWLPTIMVEARPARGSRPGHRASAWSQVAARPAGGGRGRGRRRAPGRRGSGPPGRRSRG